MKKVSLLAVLSVFVLVMAACSQSDAPKIIKTVVPARVAGQTDVLQLRAEPLPTVRIAIIGVGARGSGAVERLAQIEGTEIVAVCDVREANVKDANRRLEAKGRPKAQEFYGDTAVWRKVVALPDLDLVYIATDWVHHAPIAIQAMNEGKHAAVEVPAATNLDEIWAMVNTAERTRKHCIQLENCVYDWFELTTLNMAQQGLFGEIVHAEGAYIHCLRDFWEGYWDDWRMKFNRAHRGDLYPTHGLGPVCMALNIHRGDKLNFLVSVDTKALGNPAYLKEKRGEEVSDFRAGDHTATLIRTENGKTIMIQHDVTSPRPYNRLYQLSGTRGFANKYPVEGLALNADVLPAGLAEKYPRLSAHSFMPAALYDTLMQAYKHPIFGQIEEKAREVGGHGGMDYVMDYRLIYCLRNGLPLDMDVYDLAEWCSLVPLTEISLDSGSAPVEIPDFTRGAWNRLKGVQFAE
jgi:predicted dehydrogenase